MKVEEESFAFDKAFARLEEILENLNAEGVDLDRSLTLYEEADRLIAKCTSRLHSAEQRIETLVKNREGQLVTDETGAPRTEDFS